MNISGDKTNLVLFPYIQKYHFDGMTGLYNNFNSEVVFVNREVEQLLFSEGGKKRFSQTELVSIIEKISECKHPETSSKDIERLFEKKFLIAADAEMMFPIPEKTSYLSEMYLLLTVDCNLKCDYCTVLHNVQPSHVRYMTEDTLTKSLNLFFSDQEKKKPKEITLYGGEPLLNDKLLEHFFSEIGHYREQTNLRITLITNGTLITPKWIKIFEDHQVFVIVSIDGDQSSHDQKRIKRNGNGSFQAAVNGYRLLMDTKIKKGISLVVGPHNIDRLEKIIDYLKDELEVDSLGFTLGHIEPANIDITKNDFVNKLIASLDHCNDMGLWNEQLMKKVRALAESRPRFFGCPNAVGGCMVRILPDGNITPCENLGLRNRFLLGSVHDIQSADQIIGHEDMIRWQSRYFTSREDCRKCEAVLICGGGCPYDAYLQNGSIEGIEERSCQISKAIVQWYIEKLYREFTGAAFGDNHGIWIPDATTKRGVLKASF